jgi:hypothetical protein
MLNNLELDFYLKNQKNFPRSFKSPANLINMKNTMLQKKNYFNV